MAAKKKAASAAAPSIIPSIASPTGSGLDKGTGSSRQGKRFIIIYGPPKGRKTTSVSKLHGRRVKWLVSDSNCIPTLEALNRMPHSDDLYEVPNLQEAKNFLQKILDYVEANGPSELGFDILATDSVTQFFDWHKEEVARFTNQRFMGDNEKNNGWNQFNAEFGTFLDMLAQVAKYVTVIAIGHANEKPPAGKGNWAGLNLSPQMSIKAGRLANWILYQTIESRIIVEPTEEDKQSDAFITAELMPDGTVKHTEVIIHTTPVGAFIASVNSRMNPETGKPTLDAEEPGDLDYILVKEGLLPPRE